MPFTMPQTGPLHEGSTAQGILTGQSHGAQELEGAFLCDRTIGGGVMHVRALMTQQSRRVSIQVGRGAAGQIIKPLPAGWLLRGHGNYMVGKTPSSLGKETNRRGIHQRNAVKNQRFKIQLPYL